MWEHQRGDTCHLLGVMLQGKDNRGRHSNYPAGRHPIWTIGAPTSIIPTIFMPDAIPAATLPIYPGSRQARSMLACIQVAWFLCSNTDSRKTQHVKMVILQNSHVNSTLALTLTVVVDKPNKWYLILTLAIVCSLTLANNNANANRNPRLNLRYYSAGLPWKLYRSMYIHTHTHNCFTALWILSGTTKVSRYQKSRTILVKTIWIYWARDSEWQCHNFWLTYGILDNHHALPYLHSRQVSAKCTVPRAYEMEIGLRGVQTNPDDCRPDHTEQWIPDTGKCKKYDTASLSSFRMMHESRYLFAGGTLLTSNQWRQKNWWIKLTAYMNRRAFTSVTSSHMTSFHLNWVCCDATQFAVALTNPNMMNWVNETTEHDLVCSDWSKPWQADSLHRSDGK